MDFSSLLNSDILTFHSPDLSLVSLIQKLGISAILGFSLSVVARLTFTGKRRSLKKINQVLAMQHTHILVCLSGTFIMIIIGNSLANAFALTGALSMVRFRTNLIDPKEAAIIIMFIAIGMACGLDLFVSAITMTIITGVALTGMYWQKVKKEKMIQTTASPKETAPPKQSVENDR